MSKYYGEIGYANMVEIRPGVNEEQIVLKRMYSGDLLKNDRRLQASGSLNDDIRISNIISVVSDPYAIQNFHTIRYATFMGTKWKVIDVEVIYPRLKLTLGGVYNGV